MMSFRPSLLLGIALTTSGLLGTSSAQQSLTVELVDNFASPVQVVAPANDYERIFVVEQDGIIRVVKNGVTLATPFLDITTRTNEFQEQGLFGLAFHPDYATNGWVFVHYTNLNGNTRLDRFTVDGNNPDVIDINSRVNLMKVNQPYVNHNGGMLAFGSDGYLYLGLGDGGSAGDPQNRAQDGQSLLGKMLRLDVSSAPYVIPADNPFVGDPNVLDEIWSVGLRNPWRFSFDRATGDMWIADVGQNEIEEIDFELAGDGGLNYGWRIMEGSECFNPSSGCNQSGLVLPIQEYTHGGNPVRRSVTGGYVYRGEAMATMHGRYFYSDYRSGQTWSFRRDAQGQVADFVEHTGELARGLIASFGEDASGELYMCMLEGPVYRIVPDGMRLKSERLVAGGTSQVILSGASANGTAYLAYSVAGLGSTSVPQLGVVSDLRAPQLLAPIAVDGSGAGTGAGFVPGRAAGVTLWAQALELGSTSNVLVQVID